VEAAVRTRIDARIKPAEIKYRSRDEVTPIDRKKLYRAGDGTDSPKAKLDLNIAVPM
jgi:hypothetical protein